MDIHPCTGKQGRFPEDAGKFDGTFYTLTMAFHLTWQNVQFIFISCWIIKAAKQANDEAFAASL